MITAMDLSDVDELSVLLESDSKVVVSWRRGDIWTVQHDTDDSDRLWDAEDVLGFLLSRNAPIDLVRSALAAAYPDLDLDAWFEWVQMPDQDERRAEEQARRKRLIDEFKAGRQG